MTADDEGEPADGPDYLSHAFADAIGAGVLGFGLLGLRALGLLGLAELPCWAVLFGITAAVLAGDVALIALGRALLPGRPRE